MNRLATFAAGMLFVLVVQGRADWLDDVAVFAVDAWRWAVATRDANLAAAASATAHPDFTITTKQLVGLRLTYVLAGELRTAPVPWDCYAIAEVGAVLPAVAPGPTGPVICRGGTR